MATPRLYSPAPLASGARIELASGAARHVQVLRLQPGESVTLFDGQGGEYDARVTRMGRSEVTVEVETHRTIERETGRALHLAIGMPANERMDWLVEKATELGVGQIQPLVTERSVVRLSGERAERKRQHWQAIAVAACEQCGRNRLPTIHAARPLSDWLAEAPTAPDFGRGLLLSLGNDALALRTQAHAAPNVWFLAGPEGGLASAEETLARQAGFVPCTLGPRVLRAETAALAALATLLD